MPGYRLRYSDDSDDGRGGDEIVGIARALCSSHDDADGRGVYSVLRSLSLIAIDAVEVVAKWWLTVLVS